MKTAKEIEKGFKKDLKILLKKYNAEFDLEEVGGKDYINGLDHIFVIINNKITIDFGRYIDINELN